MNIVYSLNKRGREADYWTREISGASTDQYRFIPFNHDPYLDPNRYIRAQLLDNLYYERVPSLMRMYADFEDFLCRVKADAIVVDNCPPYHPEFLRTLSVYKALRVADGPISAYDRDFAYVHAYDHILYHSPAYSRDLGMAEKLTYCRAWRADFWPHALFDAMFDPTQSEAALLSRPRDIDVLFVGAMHVGKMAFLAKVKRALGRRCVMRGYCSLKKNVYFNLKYRLPGWIRAIDAEDFVPMYQRAKIGFNVHNRGMYTVGNYRLFDLCGNGVMQLSDGGQYLNEYFEVGREVIGFEEADELIAQVEYFLSHEDERREIALNGYRRVMRDHRFADRMKQLGMLLESGMAAHATRESGRKG